MRLNNLKLWQITLIVALLPLARFGYTMSLSTATEDSDVYSSTIMIVDASNDRPIEGAILVFTYIEVQGVTAPFSPREHPSDAQGMAGPFSGMYLGCDYHFTVTATGYTSIESFISIDGVENEKTVEMEPLIGGANGPLPPGYMFSWLDGVSLVFGLCTVGLYLKKPDATIDEFASLLA